MNKIRSHLFQKHFVLATLIAGLLIAGCGGSNGGQIGPVTTVTPPPPTAMPDWDLSVSTQSGGQPLSPALLGTYDLSGVLYDYANIPNLQAQMQKAGFSTTRERGADWRIGAGRWEIGTEVFATLSDGTPCPQQNPENMNLFATDIDLMKNRDWFTFTNGTLVASADITDARYQLDYVRAIIDTAETFGATPFVSIDHMPRALSAVQIPDRKDCGASFDNQVSNNRPADNAVFAEALTGMVRRIVEGTGSKTGHDRPRTAQYWEIWNEPEATVFWAPDFIADPDTFFDMAIPALQALDTYRSGSANSAVQNLKFGLGSFVSSGTAVSVISGFDTGNIPIDFISFHSYKDDPLVIVDEIKAVGAAINGSRNYPGIEMALAEWGPHLQTRIADKAYANSMAPALHAATVIGLGVQVGLDRAHNALFYDFLSQVAFGLLDNNVNPKPLFRSYELMAKTIRADSKWFDVQGSDEGRLDAGMGTILLSKDQANTIRALVVNRNSSARTLRLTIDGIPLTPSRIFIFDATDDAANELRELAPSTSEFDVPSESILAIEF